MAVRGFSVLHRRLPCGLLATALLVATAGLDVWVGTAVAHAVPVELQPTVLEEPAFDTSLVAVRDCPPVAEPLWTDYGLAEALFWGRDNQALNQPLVTLIDGRQPVATTRDLQFPVAAGVRTFYGRREPCDCGWEIGYFGVYGMSASHSVRAVGENFLQMPAPIGNELTADGQNATLKYNSTLNSAEANVFRTGHEWRPFSQSWLTVDWLAGFRYVGLEEQATIEMNCCAPDLVPVPYTVRTRNNMFGGQLGARGRWTWSRWAIEGWAKAGLLGNAEKQIQDPLIDYRGFEQRSGRSAAGAEAGFIGDLNLSVVYRLTDVWGIRAGYSTVWIGGVALAPNQFDFANTTTAGRMLHGSDGIFLNGANLGLEARW